MIFDKPEIVIKPNVPKLVVFGEVKVQIEIDDKPNVLNPLDSKRIKITCFDFEVESRLKMYAKRNPKILKTWS